MPSLKTKVISRLKFLRSNTLRDYFFKNVIYIFHHIPKCGGTSFVYSLRNWFWIVKDYKTTHLSKSISKPVRIEKLKQFQCLAGHFHIPGIYLHERYPKVWAQEGYKVVTSLRDPLQTRISLYYWERKIKMNAEDISLEDHLLKESNWIAARFPCTIDNYQDILDRYFFVAILEFPQESMDLLAKLMNKRPVKLRVENQTKRDAQSLALRQDVIEQFRKQNELDYLIYEYGLNKFNAIKRNMKI